MFIAGPAVVQRGLGEDVDKEALGGAHLHARESGAVDNEAQSEDDAFAQIRCFLSYLPSNAWAQPPRLASTDDPRRRDDELIRIVPRNCRRAYDVRAILAHVVDRGSPFEMARHYGPSLVTAVGAPGQLLRGGGPRQRPTPGRGRAHGRGCGEAGATRRSCDTFHVPVVNVVDQPDNADGISFGIDSDDTESTAESYLGTIRFTKP